MPAFSILLGRVMDTIGDPTSKGSLDTAALWFLYLGAAAGAAAYAEAAAWGCAGVRAGKAARVRFLEAALAKPMAFHEGVIVSSAAPPEGGEKGGAPGAVVAVSASATAAVPAAPAAPSTSSSAPATVSVRLMRALEDDAVAVQRALAVDCGPFVNQVAKVVAGLVVGERWRKERGGLSALALSPLPTSRPFLSLFSLFFSLLAGLGRHARPAGRRAHHRR